MCHLFIWPKITESQNLSPKIIWWYNNITFLLDKNNVLILKFVGISPWSVLINMTFCSSLCKTWWVTKQQRLIYKHSSRLSKYVYTVLSFITGCQRCFVTRDLIYRKTEIVVPQSSKSVSRFIEYSETTNKNETKIETKGGASQCFFAAPDLT